MKHLTYFAFFAAIIALGSCRKDDVNPIATLQGQEFEMHEGQKGIIKIGGAETGQEVTLTYDSTRYSCYPEAYCIEEPYWVKVYLHLAINGKLKNVILCEGLEDYPNNPCTNESIFQIYETYRISLRDWNIDKMTLQNKRAKLVIHKVDG